MIDSWRHKGMRKRLVETLKSKGISDAAVLEAMGKLPRHFFLDKAFEEHAYEDKAFPIAVEQTISQPFTVAYMTQKLNIKRGERVLEIGTGSGYQAGILALLGASVFTIERQEILFLSAQKLLLKVFKFENVRCFFGDGTRGLPNFAPFSKIMVTAGAPVVPENLKNQLAVGGILLIPVGEINQKMILIERISETDFSEKKLDDFRFVPLLEGIKKH